MPLELLLIRHGETEYDVEPKRIGGWSSDVLTKCGRDQVDRLCRRLCAEALRPAALHTSTLKRACETAQIIGDVMSMKPVPMDGLREINKGALTGLTIPSVKKFPDFYKAKLPVYERWPEGESYAEFHLRVTECLNGIIEQHTDGLVFVVTHGGPINAFLREIAGIPMHRHRELRVSCDDTSIHHFQRTREGWKVLRLNDAIHLKHQD